MLAVKLQLLHHDRHVCQLIQATKKADEQAVGLVAAHHLQQEYYV